jgi:hypothetical protein
VARGSRLVNSPTLVVAFQIKASTKSRPHSLPCTTTLTESHQDNRDLGIKRVEPASAMFASSLAKASRRGVVAPRRAGGARRGVFQHAAPITPTHHPKVTQLLIDGKVRL